MSVPVVDSVIAGTLPEPALRIARTALAGDAAGAAAESAALQPLWQLFAEHGSLRVVAVIAEQLGLVTPRRVVHACFHTSPLPTEGGAFVSPNGYFRAALWYSWPMTRDALRAIARLAAGQWGMISTRQAARVGVSRLMLARLTDAELLVRLSQGVYRVAGAPPPEHESILAAWLALAEPGSPPTDLVVGGVAASQLHGIGQLWMREIDLLAPARRRTRRDGVRFRIARLSARDVVTAHGVPTLSPARTVVDLLQLGESPDTVADAAFDAIELGMATAAEIHAVLALQRVDGDTSALFTVALEQRIPRQPSALGSGM